MKVYAQKQSQPQPQASSNLQGASAKPLAASHTVHPILHLQSEIGNQAVQQFHPGRAEALEVHSDTSAVTRFAHDFSRIPVHFHAPAGNQLNQRLGIQKKSLAVSHPIDSDEKEADQVARKVVDRQSVEIRGTGLTLNREGDASAETTPEFQSELERSKGSGQPLDDSIRREMESKMDADFSGVKVHTGSEAHNLSERINAKAFTQGQDIFFRQGLFNAHLKQGKELLAHELVHTVQQRKTGQVLQRQNEPKQQKAGGALLDKWKTNYLDNKEWETEKKTLASDYIKSHDIEQMGAALAVACMMKNATFKRAFSDVGLQIIDQLGKNSKGDASLIAASRLTDEQLEQGTPGLLISMYAATMGGWTKYYAKLFPEQQYRIRDAIPMAYINKPGSLTPEEINTAQTFIAKIPDSAKQKVLYDKLQQKPGYLSQRDNKYEQEVTEKGETKKVRAETASGNMCNLTSLAMCLSYLGISNPHPSMQYEDALEKIRVDNKYPARCDAAGWGKVAEHMGVKHEIFAWNVKQGQDWYYENVAQAHLQKGHAVMMSITGHIVRVQAVTDSGLVVDDPYGKSKLAPGTGRSFTTSNKSEWKNKKEGAANEGEDNVWSWDVVKAHSMKWIAYFIKK